MGVGGGICVANEEPCPGSLGRPTKCLLDPNSRADSHHAGEGWPRPVSRTMCRMGGDGGFGVGWEQQGLGPHAELLVRQRVRFGLYWSLHHPRIRAEDGRGARVPLPGLAAVRVQGGVSA